MLNACDKLNSLMKISLSVVFNKICFALNANYLNNNDKYLVCYKFYIACKVDVIAVHNEKNGSHHINVTYELWSKPFPFCVFSCVLNNVSISLNLIFTGLYILWQKIVTYIHCILCRITVSDIEKVYFLCSFGRY